MPVISWLFLRGKCRYCHKPIPGRNTLVELATGTLFALNHMVIWRGANGVIGVNGVNVSVERFGSLVEILSIVVLCCLIVIFFIDLYHQIIPDSLTLIASLCALFLIPLTQLAPMSLLAHILSALGASGFFLFLVLITRGRGMGWGDVKFAGFMGLFLGFPGIVFSLYFAFLTGAIVSAMLVLAHHKKFGQTIAFGPFLVAGTVLSHFGILMSIWGYIYGIFL